MMLCSLEEAFNTSYQNQQTELDYGQNYTYQPTEQEQNTLPVKSLCEEFRDHYSQCPECRSFCSKQNYNIIESFTNTTRKTNINSENVIILILILLLIWNMMYK